MIATNTIGQGDTRTSGLLYLRKNAGVIYDARKQVKWPGQAAVTVSVIHVAKNYLEIESRLDGKIVPLITAFLLDKGTDENPKTLKVNDGVAFTGGYPYGAGFLFDDNDEKATSINRMNQILADEPELQQYVKPYLGGGEFLECPKQQHKRFVIDLGEIPEDHAKKIKSLYSILEEKVKPERAKLKDNTDGIKRKTFWWQWGRYTPSLDAARQSKTRILMHRIYEFVRFICLRACNHSSAIHRTVPLL